MWRIRCHLRPCVLLFHMIVAEASLGLDDVFVINNGANNVAEENVSTLPEIASNVDDARIGIGIGIGGLSGQAPPPSASPNIKLETALIALQAWKSAITDDPQGISRTWVGPDVCSYKGVFCSDSGETVAGIDLNHGNVQGKLVKELSLLTDMSLFHLNSNRFSGTIPETFQELSCLKELDLSNNRLSGPFPSVALRIPNLIFFDIRYNKFSGPIPRDLLDKKLDAIFLNNNWFNGQLPANLGHSSASAINLANNNLTGSFPPGIGTDSKIKELVLLNNKLTGCFPEGIGLYKGIELLDVSRNSLVGHLPSNIACLDTIEVLNLGQNKLSGMLPEKICSLRRLQDLTIFDNFFTGFGPECMRLMLSYTHFNFEMNCVPGWHVQRPKAECFNVPGSELHCIKVPTWPLICNEKLKMAINC